MDKYKSKTSGHYHRAIQWNDDNTLEAAKFANSRFAVLPTEPDRAVVFEVSHDLKTGEPISREWFTMTKGDWVVEYTQHNIPFYITYGKQEFMDKFEVPE